MTLILGLLSVELLFSVQLTAAVFVLVETGQVLSLADSDLEPVVLGGKMVMMAFGAEWSAVES